MAGDVGFKEARIVSMAGGPARGPFPLLHDYGPQLAIAMAGTAAFEAKDAFAAAAVNEDALSENERFGLQALRLRETDGYAIANRPGPTPI